MQRLALCFALGLVLLTSAFTGCARDPEPKYVMPDVPYVDPAELRLGMAGGAPAPKDAKEAKEKVPGGKSKEKPAAKEAKKEKQDDTEKGKAEK